jgi:hypothetical protein
MKTGCKNCVHYGLYRMIVDNSASDTDFLLEFRWAINKESNNGDKTCSLYVNGKKVISDSGSEHDMRATCLAEWFEGAFRDRLMKLEIPVSSKDGKKIQEYEGLMYQGPDPNNERQSQVPFEGTIPVIDGSVGMSAVDTIIQACGLQIQLVYSEENHEVYRLTEIPVPNESELATMV